MVQVVPKLLDLERKRVDGPQHFADGGQVSGAGRGSAYRRTARLADADLLAHNLNALLLVLP